MADTQPRLTGEIKKLDKETYRKRFKEQFNTPAFDSLRVTIEELTDAAWKNYQDGAKAPRTRKAGADYADPDYDLSLEWIKTRDAILQAEKINLDPNSPDRILLICASNRNDQTCAGEISKSSRMVELALKQFLEDHCIVDMIDLSELTHEFEKKIYPCKACVSTAMPLCHWPCSCYPNHKLGQVNDWMNEIYPQWVRAHGIMIITPTYWHQAPSSLKLMMDRMVCADGGNADPTLTHGKSAKKAKEVELAGWNYPRHLSGRSFSIVAHGDAMGVDDIKSALCDWLEEMDLTPSGNYGNIGRYVDYMGTYAESHAGFDKDENLHHEIKNAARALIETVRVKRKNKDVFTYSDIKDPRPK